MGFGLKVASRCPASQIRPSHFHHKLRLMITYHDVFDSKYVTHYLEHYVDDHVYNGQSLRDGIRFKLKVVMIDKLDKTWMISIMDHEAKELQLICSRFVLATGYTTIPQMPLIPDQSRFQGPILHQNFGKATTTILASEEYKHITILGGGKSAVDMVYDSVKAGKNVGWIIRASGEGSAAFAGAAGKGPYENGPEIVATRMLSALYPFCFTPVSWWTRMIHGSTYERSIISKICLGADQACRDFANFQDRKGALPGFQKVESSTV